MLADHVDALQRGARLNQYEISNVLGAGGFGITYLAEDTLLDAPVAIKEYLPGDLASRQANSQVTAKSTATVNDFQWGLNRFMEEARTLAKFRHGNIVHVNQVFEANNTAYIVMEYAKGETLSEYLQRCAPLDEAKTRDILIPIMDGLRRVHERNFLHRDIKPGNIILRDDGGPVLIDFGAARQAIETKSRSITSIVTEGYAPLEQYDPNGNQGPWTDIYALGAVAYKCLTGNTPPAATSRVRNDPLAPLDVAAKGRVSKELASAVMWALSVYEEQRPQSIDAFAKAIEGDFSASGANQPPEMTRYIRPAVSEPVTPATAPVEANSSRSSPPPSPAPASAPSNIKMSPQMIAIAGCVVLVLAVGAVAFSVMGRVSAADQSAWEKAAHSNTIESYQAYLKVLPDGHYSEQAQRLVTDREKQTEDAWADALKQNTIAAMQAYIGKYGSEGRHIADARRIADELDKKNLEVRDAYNQAVQAKSRTSYTDFLLQYGSSNYAADVRTRLSQCAMKVASRASVARELVQASGVGQGSAAVACDQAGTMALNRVRSSCSLKGGSILNESVAPGSPQRNSWAERNLRGNEYTCAATATASCVRTVGSNTQREVCP